MRTGTHIKQSRRHCIFLFVAIADDLCCGDCIVCCWFGHTNTRDMAGQFLKKMPDKVDMTGVSGITALQMTSQWPEGSKLPFADCQQQAGTAALAKGKLTVLLVKFREFLAQCK